MGISIGDPADRTTGRLLRSQAEQRGDHVYLMDEAGRLSFSTVNERVNRLAWGLKDLGVSSGAAVASYIENSIDAVILSFALAKLGAVFVPTNVDFRGDFLLRVFEQGASKYLVVDEDLVPRVAELWDRYRFPAVIVRGRDDEARARLAGARVEGWEAVAAGKPDEPPENDEVRPSDLAAVMWTSGTTGPPKGVMQSHNLWLVDAAYMTRKRDWREGDVFYNTMPLYQSGAWLCNLYPGLLTGSPVGFDARFSVSEFWERCRFYGATQMFTLGAMHMYLWQAPPRSDDRDNPVRVGLCVPMPEMIHEPFKERFGLEFIAQAFGQSECMPWSMTDRSRPWKPNSSGVARDGIEVKIFDGDDREVPPGEVGEVCIRPSEADVLFSGYYRDSAATVAAWRNLWYHSGDLGRIDEDGEFFFVDRKADFMRHKGRNISSFEIESVAARHPAVAEVAAHGVPAEELDSEDEIKLCVVLKPGHDVTPEELAAFINANAPYYMVPRYIEFLPDLPHTPTGRIQKYRLRTRGAGPSTWDRRKTDFVVTR